MSAITIKLDPMPDGTAFGAMVDVIPLGGQQGVERSRLAVSSSAPTPITVAHGRYLVQAIRPDGTVLSTTVDATSEPDVVAKLEHPQVEPNPGPKTSLTAAFVDKGITDARILLIANYPVSPSLWHRKFWSTRLGRFIEARFLFGASRPGSVLRLLTPLRLRDYRAPVPAVLLVRHGTSFEVLRVPETLTSSEDGYFITLEWHKLETDPLRFVATNPDVAMLTDYIASGDALTASQLKPDLWNTAVAELRMERACPPAAVIAGYLLVATEQHKSDHEWTEWIENLADWFEDIPDGAIFSGWRALRSGDTEKARTRFVQAIVRGLPILTGSIRMLHRGLIALNDGEQLNQIHDVVTSVQPGRVFTTLRWEDNR